MLERCPWDKANGDVVCRDGFIWVQVDGVWRTNLEPCGWDGHYTSGITHCCEGIREQPAADRTGESGDA